MHLSGDASTIWELALTLSLRPDRTIPILGRNTWWACTDLGPPAVDLLHVLPAGTGLQCLLIQITHELLSEVWSECTFRRSLITVNCEL